MLGSVCFLCLQGAFAFGCNHLFVYFDVLQPIRTLCSNQFAVDSYATDFIVYVHRNAEGLVGIYTIKIRGNANQLNQGKRELTLLLRQGENAAGAPWT